MKNSQFESVMLHVSIIQIEWYIAVYYCSCFMRHITAHVFCKIFRNTHRTHIEYEWSLYYLDVFFKMQISLILKIQSISV